MIVETVWFYQFRWKAIFIIFYLGIINTLEENLDFEFLRIWKLFLVWEVGT